MTKDKKIGEFQKFNHPANAEHYIKSDFTKYIEGTKLSKFLGRKVEERKEVFHCPKCGKAADYEQGHGDAYKCGKCGLNRQSFGNGLYVWDDGIVLEQTDETALELKEMLEREIKSALADEDYELIAELKGIFDRALGK